jgi:hypothetical protein
MTEPRTQRRLPEMNKRRGHSLIELLVVIAATTALLGIGLGILHMLMRLEGGSRKEVGQRAAMGRLAVQFRRDAHAAEELIRSTESGNQAGPPAWQLSIAADRVVEYRLEPEELIRTERTGDEIVHQELFCLPEQTTVSIDSVGEAAPGIVRLRVTLHGPRALLSMRHGLSVEAQLAKDRRFIREPGP